jgi:hypothetical protein
VGGGEVSKNVLSEEASEDRELLCREAGHECQLDYMIHVGR